MPLFSIVVPAYNAGRTLAETLHGVLDQECGDWECIVVDDGSEDDTLAMASAYVERDGRFRVVTQANQGVGGAYNTGVALARGDFVVICSADDILLPQHLTEMAHAIATGGSYDIYSSNGYYWGPDGTRTVVYSPGEIPDSMTLAQVIRNCFYSVGAAYRRELFDRVGGYRLGVFGEDYDFWLRAMAGGARHRYLSQPLSLHRISPTQKSADLEAAYRSDIRLVSDLRRSTMLSAEELQEVDDCIRRRERYLSHRTSRPVVRGLRGAVLGLATAVLGRSRVQRVSQALRARTSKTGKP